MSELMKRDTRGMSFVKARGRDSLPNCAGLMAVSLKEGFCIKRHFPTTAVTDSCKPGANPVFGVVTRRSFNNSSESRV